jgi:DNA-binding NtrC family response regulator
MARIAPSILKRLGKNPLPYISALQTNDEQKPQVLVAEADTPVRAQMVRLLSQDCQVVCAETVRRALWLVKRYHFDLVICDLELPQSGGIALLHYVEMLAPETMAILLMAQADQQMARTAFKYGAFDCYVKPLTEETVRRLLYLLRNGFQNQ